MKTSSLRPLAKQGVIICLWLLALVLVAAWRLAGNQLLGVQSGSMAPLFHRGDALLLAKVKPDQLHPGDIVSYHSTLNPRVIISHRIVATHPATGSLVTKGDALQVPDPPFAVSAVQGKPTLIVPKLGYVIDFVYHPLGLILLVYTPAVLICWSETKRLMRHYAGQHYYLAWYRPQLA